MSALAKVVEPEVEIEEKPVLIHVRFMPSGDIFTIDAVPEKMMAKAWLQKLQTGAPQYYQTLAGGRGFFRIPRATYEQIMADAQ
jgi:hypothetical protein